MRCHFSNLDSLRTHLLRIERNNHATSGNWTAAQNFYHLASAFEGSITGLPMGYPKLVRLVIRPFRWVVTSYRFPPWLPIPTAIKHRLAPPENVDFDEQRSRLLASIDAFEEYTGTHPSHPVLGTMTHREWIGFHLRHCEHHLSFIALPSDAG